MLTFPGGVHPKENKSTTQGKPIKEVPLPERVVIPLHQHIGAPCQPLVKKGDKVEEGQKIGESDAFVSSPVHSSVSGKVKSIEPYLHPLGYETTSVVVETDKENPASEYTKLTHTLSAGEIRERIKEAGLVGMGGAAFPTHVKLTPPEGKPIDTIIINGCECEPYLTSDHRLMLENPNEIVEGAKLVLKAVEAEKAFIAIEDNKQDAIESMENAAGSDIDVVKLKTKYPQGAEKQLIKAILKREVPSGGLPLDVGVVVQNVGTAYAIYEAVTMGKPLISRVITVTGSGVREPQNLRVRIGTLASDLIQECGGLQGEPGKVIFGGPMMGFAQHTFEVPVIKGTSGILVLREGEVSRRKSRPCLNCARCVDACPLYLMPTLLAKYAEFERFEDAERYGAMDCIECGVCSYVCPSEVPLVQLIKLAKAQIANRKKG